MGYIKGLIGGAAGGTLGFIGGGVSGAVIGGGAGYLAGRPMGERRDQSKTVGSADGIIKAGGPIVSANQKVGSVGKTSQNMPYFKRRRTGSAPADYAKAGRGKMPSRTRRRVGSAPSKRGTRRTRINKKRRARQARRAVKAVVNNVLQCKENVGVYTKTYGGDLNPNNLNDQMRVAFSMNRFQTNGGPYTPFTMGWHPHSVKRVLDAVSVLYNGKAANINIDATGNFIYQGFKCDVLYASYKLDVFNYTDLPYEMEFIEVTNKGNKLQNFTDDLEEFINGQSWVSGTPFFNKDEAVQYNYKTGLDFGMLKGIATNYSLKSIVKGVVKPGEKISYFSTLKDKCIDFGRHVTTQTAGATPEVASYAKGEKQVVLLYRPVAHLQQDLVAGTYSLSHNDKTANVGTEEAKDRGFVCEIKEVFKVLQPAETLDIHEGEQRAILTDLFTVSRGATNCKEVFKSTGPAYVTREPIES